MIKLTHLKYCGDFDLLLTFSDGSTGHFHGNELLKHSGPLLQPLHDEAFFKRCFIDAGALCWPNGLELSPTKLHQSCMSIAT